MTALSTVLSLFLPRPPSLPLLNPLPHRSHPHYPLLFISFFSVIKAPLRICLVNQLPSGLLCSAVLFFVFLCPVAIIFCLSLSSIWGAVSIDCVSLFQHLSLLGDSLNFSVTFLLAGPHLLPLSHGVPGTQGREF